MEVVVCRMKTKVDNSFYINLPLGGAAVLMIFFFFNPPKRNAEMLSLREKMRRMDFIGASLLIPAVAKY